MAKLDSNIYGADDMGYAQRVSSNGLDTSQGKEDIWGGTFDQEARSKGVDNDSGENTEARAVRYVGTQTPTKSKGN